MGQKVQKTRIKEPLMSAPKNDLELIAFYENAESPAAKN